MKHELGPIAIVLTVAALIGAAIWTVAAQRSEPATIEMAGRVYADERVATVPLLRSDSPTTAATPGQPAVAGRLARVNVSVGDDVTEGEVLATLETAPLDAAIDAARASAAEASATVALLDEKAATAADGRSTLDSKRHEISSTLSDLRRQRAEIAANLASARALLTSLAAMPSAVATPPAGPAQPDPRAIVAQLEAALAQLDAGIAKAESGLAKLDDARASVADAIVVLGDARTAAGYAADGASAGVAVAEARRALATVRSPVSGVVTEISAAGTVVYAGAPLARIRPEGDPIVETYATVSDTSLLRLGTKVQISADYLRRPIAGVVTEVSDAYQYPPTAQATRDTHMVRALRVRVRVPDGKDLPPGAPVDIIVSTGR